jgi:hypothetical protein
MRLRSGRGVTPKLAFLVLVVAATACALLAVRQQRLEAVGAMADSLRRSAALDRTTQLFRVEITRRVTPERVAWLTERHGGWRNAGQRMGAPALYALGTLLPPGADDEAEPGTRSAEASR